MKRYTYTFIQIVAAGLLITIKVTSFAFLFPFILVLLVPFRKWCLPWVFTERELTEVSDRASLTRRSPIDISSRLARRRRRTWKCLRRRARLLRSSSFAYLMMQRAAGVDGSSSSPFFSILLLFIQIEAIGRKMSRLSPQ